MVLGGELPGRVGRRRNITHDARLAYAWRASSRPEPERRRTTIAPLMAPASRSNRSGFSKSSSQSSPKSSSTSGAKGSASKRSRGGSSAGGGASRVGGRGSAAARSAAARAERQRESARTGKSVASIAVEQAKAHKAAKAEKATKRSGGAGAGRSGPSAGGTKGRSGGADSKSRSNKAGSKSRAASTPSREHPERRKRRRRTVATDELQRLAGAKADRVLNQLAAAADAYESGRERDALRMLRPLVTSYPDASGVRELVGLCQYRLGNFPAAQRELEAFVELTDSTEAHPVLMDCYRAQRMWSQVDECWRELAEASPSAELVTEGRIVLAGSLADRGRRDEAISLLEKRMVVPKRVQDHHARLWYALADLHERAGNVIRARALFQQVAKYDRQFADVAERLAALR